MLLKRVTRLLTICRWSSDDTKVPATVKSNKLEVNEKESKKSLECVKECALLPKTVKTPAYAPLKSVNVAIMGAYLPLHHSLCVTLKSNCLIKEIRMYDEAISMLHGVAMDIGQINTSTKVVSCVGQHQLKRALNRADIVVISAEAEPDDIPDSQDVFCKNAEHVKTIAHACITHCPEAVFVINVYPINATVPLFCEIFLKNGVLCPNRVLGSMAVEEMRARTLASIALGLNPRNIQVDVIGGGTPNTAIPVISGTKPGGKYLKKDFNNIYKKFAYMTRELLATKKCPPTLSAGYALSQLVSNVAKGLCGKQHNPTSVFIRTSALFGIKYLSVPVYFGLAGVEKNLGLPALSLVEMEALDTALAGLQLDITMGEEYAKPRELNKNIYPVVNDDSCVAMPSCPNL